MCIRDRSYCIKIVDECGRELAPGQVGEICVHGVPGRSLVLGYYKDEEAVSYTHLDVYKRQ